MEIAVVRDAEGDRSPFVGDQLRRAIDHAADGGVFHTDDPDIRDERPEPMKEVENFRPTDAGEEVLVPAREANDFVREDRTKDE